ncbi:MAG: N-acetylornithine carbamoyltransferase [Planctomycetes bacterium]|nr:N-acetylornithine carbamoyltransferase [Planctomycetota bacterium]
MTAPRHFYTTADLPREALDAILDRARRLKSDEEDPGHPLAGRSLAMVFFNSSLRTRVSFELAMVQLGGHAVDLTVGAGVWDLEVRDGAVMDGDKAEHARDAVRVLSRYADALGVRSFPRMRDAAEDAADPVLAAFLRHATVPVINLESCLWHPCQALADALTIRERLGEARGRRLVVAWAWHPKALPRAVPQSAALVAAQLGMEVVVHCPPGYELDPAVFPPGLAPLHEPDPGRAFRRASVVYAKSWGPASPYGSPPDPGLRPWIVDQGRMDRTAGAILMHCLPVRRNVVATDGVLDGPASVIYDQAENRLHAQKALLLEVLGTS